jgi:hypothetical protein
MVHASGSGKASHPFLGFEACINIRLRSFGCVEGLVFRMESAMWSEKYRLVTLTEMRNQVDVVNRLKRFAETKAMPHCLFAGR